MSSRSTNVEIRRSILTRTMTESAKKKSMYLHTLALFEFQIVQISPFIHSAITVQIGTYRYFCLSRWLQYKQQTI